MREIKGMDLGGRGIGEELRGVGEGETVVRIYSIFKKSIFQKKKAGHGSTHL